MYKFRNQRGQALLIVVLTMVVALTVGLSVVSRSITNLRNTQQDVDSQKALSAAEAGIERAIQSGVSVANVNLSNVTQYQSTLATVSGQSYFLLNGNNRVVQDDAMYIWLTPYSANNSQLFRDVDRWSGTLNLYWGDASTACNNAALEVAVVWNTRANPLVTRYAYDPCNPGRTSKNNFTPASSLNQTISGIALHYANGAGIPITNGFLVRVVPLYVDSYIGALGSSVLPAQGTMISSTGSTTNSNIRRELSVFQGYPEIPAELFPFSLFWP